MIDRHQFSLSVFFKSDPVDGVETLMEATPSSPSPTRSRDRHRNRGSGNGEEQILQTRVNRFKSDKDGVDRSQLKGYSCDVKFTGTPSSPSPTRSRDGHRNSDSGNGEEQILQTRVNRFKSDKDKVDRSQLKGYSCDVKLTDMPQRSLFLFEILKQKKKRKATGGVEYSRARGSSSSRSGASTFEPSDILPQPSGVSTRPIRRKIHSSPEEEIFSTLSTFTLPEGNSSVSNDIDLLRRSFELWGGVGQDHPVDFRGEDPREVVTEGVHELRHGFGCLTMSARTMVEKNHFPSAN